MTSDEELMEEALENFDEMASAKFMAGIMEHNPNGNKGLARMKSEDLVLAVKEEIIDLWFYLAELEKRVGRRRK